jgi:hypothetical protein
MSGFFGTYGTQFRRTLWASQISEIEPAAPYQLTGSRNSGKTRESPRARGLKGSRAQGRHVASELSKMTHTVDPTSLERAASIPLTRTSEVHQASLDFGQAPLTFGVVLMTY